MAAWLLQEPVTAKDLSLAELREVRSRCHAVGLGAGALGALDDAIAGARAYLLCGACVCCMRRACVCCMREARPRSFPSASTSRATVTSWRSSLVQARPSHWCKPHGTGFVGMATEVTTWHCFGTTHRSQNCIFNRDGFFARWSSCREGLCVPH